MGKMMLYWIIATLITLSAAYYQRTTGPTYPKRLTIDVNDVETELKLVRSLSLDDRAEIKLNMKDTNVQARLYFRRYPTNEEYRKVDFSYKSYKLDSWFMNKVFKISKDEGFFAEVEQQAPAGKIQYYFEITDTQGTKNYFQDEPIVVRFKGAVPSIVLTPHIFFMFFAMLLATLSGILAIFRNKYFRIYTFVTFIFLLIGGMILGPVVQKYAFGDLWTGVPFGWDLTDNKTLIAFIFWIIAVIGNVRKERRILTIIATIVLLLVYSIPHSMFGSELDYESGEVTQGLIYLVPFLLLKVDHLKNKWNNA